MIYWSYVVFQIQTLEFDEKENASAEKFEEEYARDGKCTRRLFLVRVWNLCYN